MPKGEKAKKALSFGLKVGIAMASIPALIGYEIGRRVVPNPNRKRENNHNRKKADK